LDAFLITAMPPCPKILFLSLTDDAGTNRPVAELARLGCVCAVLSPPGFTCARSRFASRHFRLPHHRGIWMGILGARSGLVRAMREWYHDLIVPLDDVAARLLHGLAEGRSASIKLRRALETSLGSPAGYDAACSRVQFLELATRLGVRAPTSRAVESSTALETAAAMGYPVVLKLEHSCAGRGVTIAHDPTQLKAAIVAAGFGRWRSLTRYWALLKRGKEAGKRLVWKLAGLRTPAKTTFELQQFVHGRGAMRDVAAWQGRVLAGVSFEQLCIHPSPTGPSSVIRFIEHPEMEATVLQLVAALGYSGFASFDFMIEKDSGHAFVIELNARTTGSMHLGRLFGHDVCGAMARQLGGLTETVEAAAPREERLIVLFPNELERDPESAWLRPGSGAFHDVPWDDPAIFEIYYNQLLRRYPGHAAEIARLLVMEDHAVETSA
jgi:hypothetical protein